MKKLLLLFLIITFSSFAQNTSKLEKRLNQELKNELQLQLENPNFSGDTLVVVREFKINQNKVLSYQTKHNRYNGDGYYIRKQEVNLKDILSVSKDICVLFVTNEKVKITDTNYHQDGSGDTHILSDTYFRIQFCNQKGNEGLGYELVELFKKAGYSITISNWYD